MHGRETATISKFQGSLIQRLGPCRNVGAKMYFADENVNFMNSRFLKNDLMYCVRATSYWFYCYRHICYFKGKC